MSNKGKSKCLLWNEFILAFFQSENSCIFDIESQNITWLDKDNNENLILKIADKDNVYAFLYGILKLKPNMKGVNKINCYNIKSGNLVWAYELDNIGLYFEKDTSLVIENTAIGQMMGICSNSIFFSVFGDSNSQVLEIDKNTGKFLNSYFFPSRNLILDSLNNKIYYPNKESILEFDIDSKKTCFVYENSMGRSNISFGIIGNSLDFLAISSYPYSIFDNKQKGNHLFLLNKKNSQIEWEFFQESTPISKALFKDKYLFVICPKEILIFEKD